MCESQPRTRSESLCPIGNIVSCDIITTSLCPKIQDWLDDNTHTHTHTYAYKVNFQGAND